jgi:hypothetical protein
LIITYIVVHFWVKIETEVQSAEGRGRGAGMNKKMEQRAEALERLRALGIKPGDTLYTVIKHRARSGMLRVLDVYYIKDNEPLRITWAAAHAAGYSYDERHEGARMHGTGMDMGFALVYAVSHALYPVYTCTGDHCPAAEHTNNPTAARDGKTEHKDGYALNHRWM